MNDPVVLVLPDIHGRDFYKDISTLVLAMCFMKKAYLLRLILDALKSRSSYGDIMLDRC